MYRNDRTPVADPDVTLNQEEGGKGVVLFCFPWRLLLILWGEGGQGQHDPTLDPPLDTIKTTDYKSKINFQ